MALERSAGAAVGLGFLLAASSSVGQTFFVSLFSGQIRAELALSHGAFGLCYTAATLAGGFCLLFLGSAADRIEPSRLAAVTLVALSVASAAFAVAATPWLLVLALFGLRFLGQGMLSHISATAVGRWFSAGRGKALSLAGLGHAAGQAVLPAVVAALLTVLSWREIWFSIAALMSVVLVPAVLLLARYTPVQIPNAPSRDSGRQEVLQDRRFYLLLPGVLAPPFIVTAVFFHQVHLIELKGWDLDAFTLTYPLFAAAATVVSLGAGLLVDRFGALRLVPVYLIPLAVGLFVLSVGDSILAANLFMLLVGCSSGGATVVLGALWPEMYGTEHLGAIRAMVMTLMVITTAVSPGLTGVLIDAGVGLPGQAIAFSVYTFTCAGVLGLLLPHLDTQ